MQNAQQNRIYRQYPILFEDKNKTEKAFSSKHAAVKAFISNTGGPQIV